MTTDQARLEGTRAIAANRSPETSDFRAISADTATSRFKDLQRFRYARYDLMCIPVHILVPTLTIHSGHQSVEGWRGTSDFGTAWGVRERAAFTMSMNLRAKFRIVTSCCAE